MKKKRSTVKVHTKMKRHSPVLSMIGCYIASRENETIFTITKEGCLQVNLREYALLPMEDYTFKRKRK